MTGLLSPALVLGAVLSTAYAALFHLWHKGGIAALWNDLLAAWLGFAGGYFVGDVAGVQLLKVGHLDIFSGTVGAMLALLIAKSLEA